MAADDTRPTRSSIEVDVIAVFQEVLGRAGIAAEDDFFSMGGNSIAATLVVSRLLSRYGVELGIEQFFETPTPSGLAAAVHLALTA